MENLDEIEDEAVLKPIDNLDGTTFLLFCNIIFDTT